MCIRIIIKAFDAMASKILVIKAILVFVLNYLCWVVGWFLIDAACGFRLMLLDKDSCQSSGNVSFSYRVVALAHPL